MTMTEDTLFPEKLHTISKPIHKSVWTLPAAVNFILGGTAGGYYLLWSLSEAAAVNAVPHDISVGLVSVLLVSAGLAAVALEAGRALRARYLLTHLKRSWMSREAVAAIVFIIAVVVYMSAGWSPAGIIAGISACAFILSQGMMVFRCTAVPVWANPMVPVLFISSGVAAGYGLLLVHRVGLIFRQIQVPPYVDAVAFACLAAGFYAWMVIRQRLRASSLKSPARRLLRPVQTVMMVGVGQVLPAAVLLIVRPWSWSTVSDFQSSLAVVAALALLAGNCAQKLWLTRHAQYICGMQLGSSEWK